MALSGLATRRPISGHLGSIHAAFTSLFPFESASYRAEMVGNGHAIPCGMCTLATTQQLEPSWMKLSLAAARQGDPDAFTLLIAPHRTNLQKLAQRIIGNAEDAEDICQESLLRAFTKLDQFDSTKTQTHEFRAWLMRITANCAIDYLRRKGGRHHVPLDECHEAPSELHTARRGWGENPESCYTREEQVRVVKEAIASLPAELRMVCLFRMMEERSTKEVAARLGISAITVRVRLFRAQGQLRKIVSQRTRGKMEPGRPKLAD